MPKSILLCDDEIHILRAAEFKLVRAGFEVRCAGDGEEAWEEIKRQCPDLLITDCQMPRLDGFGLVERIRANTKFAQLPVLMLTAKGYELAHAGVAEKWRILAVLPKPFSPRELVRISEEVLATGAVSSDARMSTVRGA